jgi:hypothetical protein
VNLIVFISYGSIFAAYVDTLRPKPVILLYRVSKAAVKLEHELLLEEGGSFLVTSRDNLVLAINLASQVRCYGFTSNSFFTTKLFYSVLASLIFICQVPR